MKMALGIGMILFGAIFVHVASHSDNPGNIQEVWASILGTLSGSESSFGSADTGGDVAGVSPGPQAFTPPVSPLPGTGGTFNGGTYGV